MCETCDRWRLMIPPRHMPMTFSTSRKFNPMARIRSSTCNKLSNRVVQWIGLRENLNRKPWFLPSNIGVSCKFSHHPILWVVFALGKLSHFQQGFLPPKHQTVNFVPSLLFCPSATVLKSNLKQQFESQKKLESHFWLPLYYPKPLLRYLNVTFCPSPALEFRTCSGPGWGRTACGTGRRLDRLPREDICSPGSEIYAKYVVKYEEREELAKSNVCHLSEWPEVVSQFFAPSNESCCPSCWFHSKCCCWHTKVGRSHLNILVTVPLQVSLAACTVRDGLGMSGNL